jgi:hypothetical protein
MPGHPSVRSGVSELEDVSGREQAYGNAAISVTSSSNSFVRTLVATKPFQLAPPAGAGGSRSLTPAVVVAAIKT